MTWLLFECRKAMIEMEVKELKALLSAPLVKERPPPYAAIWAANHTLKLKSGERKPQSYRIMCLGESTIAEDVESCRPLDFDQLKMFKLGKPSQLGYDEWRGSEAVFVVCDGISLVVVKNSVDDSGGCLHVSLRDLLRTINPKERAEVAPQTLLKRLGLHQNEEKKASEK